MLAPTTRTSLTALSRSWPPRVLPPLRLWLRWLRFGRHRSLVSPLARRAGDATRIRYGSKLCSRLRNPSEQLGEHSAGVGGCLASAGKGGIWNG